VRRAGLAAASALLLSGCGVGEFYKGPAPVILPAHVKNIAVRPIARKVETPGHNIVGWEDKLRLRIQEELIRDGRFSGVNDEEQADGVLYGEIVRLLFQPLSYDANNVVQETKLWVVMNVGFYDRVEQRTLWEETNLEQEFLYFASTQPGGLTDDEARDELWDRFAGDIIKRMVEGFGSVTGASERKISPEPTPAEAPVPPPAPERREAPPSPY
jgi:hypothetical protein